MHPASHSPLYRWRKRRNALLMSLSLASAGLGILLLMVILGTLLRKSVGGLSLAVFTEMTPPPGSRGGLLNAIVGSLMMTAIGIALGTPIGILAGTWMAEYGRTSRLASIVRFTNDILLSAPSIVIGLFVYSVLVAPFGGYSALAGGFALAVLVIPIVVRTTEDMLLLVPDQLREAAAALGLPRHHVIRQVTWRAARAGIVTGVLLAVARISGETAPLLFTALGNQFWSLDMTGPMASLPVVIFKFALSPYKDWQALAWAGALLITASVLALSIAARLVSRKDG